MAPGARLVVGKVLSYNGEGQIYDMIHGIEWVIRCQEEYQIKILNISVGLNEVEDERSKKLLLDTVEEAWRKGIAVVVAAGNKGPAPMSLSPMGACRKVITVGCHEGGYFGNRINTCESYSGRGPRDYELKKPDIVAPGTDITSCSHRCKKLIKGYRNAYASKSGTSMATPIIAGGLALLIQKNPRLTNDELKTKLTYSATDLQEHWSKQGWGMINIKRLLEE